MALNLVSNLKLIKQAASDWLQLGLSRLGAALAFYALFAIAPLFVIVLAMAHFIFGAETARAELFHQLSAWIGGAASAAIKTLVAAASKPKNGGWETILSSVMLFIAATGLFVHLQHALNTIWGVRRAPGHALRNFIRDRIISFALIVALGLLLLGFLALGSGLSPTGKFLSGLTSAQQDLWRWADFAISFVVITLLFALIFKMLPDVKIPWRVIRAGAIVTSLFFTVGKVLIALYLAKSSVSSAYGAAGSLVIVLLWIYYSAQTVILGAKFTQLYAASHGSKLEPVRGAQVV